MHFKSITATSRASCSRQGPNFKNALRCGVGVAILTNAFLLPQAVTAQTLAGISGILHEASQDACRGPQHSHRRYERFSSISGDFVLYDKLELATTTEPIDIVIHQQPGCGPSSLDVRSETGSVDIKFATDYESPEYDGWRTGTHLHQSVPSTKSIRPIIVRIMTRSGRITTVIPAGNGSSTTLTSHSGTIKSKFFVHSAGSNHPITHISTSTNTGKQDITVVESEPCTARYCPPLNRLSTSHRSARHGNIKIRYPSTWQGQVHASTNGAGVVDIQGQDLHYTTRETKKVIASRGPNANQGSIIRAEISSQGLGNIFFNADSDRHPDVETTRANPSTIVFDDKGNIRPHNSTTVEGPRFIGSTTVLTMPASGRPKTDQELFWEGKMSPWRVAFWSLTLFVAAWFSLAALMIFEVFFRYFKLRHHSYRSSKRREDRQC